MECKVCETECSEDVLVVCSSCNERVCDVCTTTCDECGDVCCIECIIDGLCPRCRDEEATEVELEELEPPEED